MSTWVGDLVLVMIQAVMGWSGGPPAPAPAAGAEDVPVTVTCPVAGKTTVRFLLPAGRHVARGELICELDPTDAQRRLDHQTFELRQAEAALANARLQREADEIGVKESAAAAPQEREAFQQQIAIAEKELELSRTLLAEAIKDEDHEREAAARSRVSRAEQGVQTARAHVSVYETTTLPKRTRELANELTRSQARERNRQEQLAQAQKDNERLKKQVAACRIEAPMAGTLLYVRPPGTMGEGHYVVLHKGAAVLERQPLFRIVPDKAAPPAPGR